jgi:hypothetical protein
LDRQSIVTTARLNRFAGGVDVNAVATIEGRESEAGRGFLPAPTPLSRSRVALRSLDDVAAELARVYRLADRCAITMENATKRAYILHTLGKVIEASVIEKRLSVLEEIADGLETRAA